LRFIAVVPYLLACLASAQDKPDVALPPGVRAVWDVSKAWHETTPTRERISINGLWRWQPASSEVAQVPTENWGYYKVPACWPGLQDYMQSDYQTLYKNPHWATANLSDVQSAWYERTVTIPKDWTGRRIALDVEYLNSFAAVYIDGAKAGEIRFPDGEIDLSAIVRPGATHMLTLMVAALPLKAVMESYTDTDTAHLTKGKVERRGLCGDIWLVCEPSGPRLGEIKIDTSYRNKQITFGADLRGLSPTAHY
jgi:hypothetical protein